MGATKSAREAPTAVVVERSVSEEVEEIGPDPEVLQEPPPKDGAVSTLFCCQLSACSVTHAG